MIRDLPRQSWTEELKSEHKFDASDTADYVVIATAPITDCAVCKDDFENEDVTLALPCRHVFHEVRRGTTVVNSIAYYASLLVQSCITPWLERSGTCPVCRHQLVSCHCA